MRGTEPHQRHHLGGVDGAHDEMLAKGAGATPGE